MLELRPNCEFGDADLPPDANARICSFERTFCAVLKPHGCKEAAS